MQEPEDRVQATFDRLAADYDALKLAVIPGYRQMQTLVSDVAGLARPGAARPDAARPGAAPIAALELGCGTGEWAEAFLEGRPRARYTGVEFAAQMRAVASARLARFGRRARILTQDINQGLPDGPYSLVVSFFALHHVVDKARLFRDIRHVLAPGGRLVYADVFRAADPAVEAAFILDWVGFMREAGLDEGRIQNVLADHRENDLPEPVGRQLEDLYAAGFETVELLWAREKFGVIYAARSKGGI